MSLAKHEFLSEEAEKPERVLRLAAEFHRASQTLLPLGRPRQPMSRAPFRLSAIHAIELYLNAFLLSSGESWNKIRGMQHNLARRAELAAARGLVLRKKTTAHLEVLSRTNEYLNSRYDPSPLAPSELTRLGATLDQVAARVTAAVKTKRGSAPSPGR